MYQLYITRCGTIITFALSRVNKESAQLASSSVYLLIFVNQCLKSYKPIRDVKMSIKRIPFLRPPCMLLIWVTLHIAINCWVSNTAYWRSYLTERIKDNASNRSPNLTSCDLDLWSFASGLLWHKWDCRNTCLLGLLKILSDSFQISRQKGFLWHKSALHDLDLWPSEPGA